MITEIKEYINNLAISFGAKIGLESGNSYIERKNISEEALKSKGAYFGFVEPEEGNSGPYHDFSLVIFPSQNNRHWVISLGVGSLGFKNDYELSTYPGVRRLFSKLITENGFCKSDFSDIETSLPKSFIGRDDLALIKDSLLMYSKVLPACEIIDDPSSEKGRQIIVAFVAAYAQLRNWASNKAQRKNVADALAPFSKAKLVNHTNEISQLLNNRKFVVIQGPPGTGKTRTAKEIAQQLYGEVFFTQFHAETAYSDFIYGIRPDTAKESLVYKDSYGVFYKALKFAIDNKAKRVILIIDELNRANLANVFGPIFYLFEHKMESSSIEIEVAPGLIVNHIPNNLYVISTMNTADRSLAVVDFALRRRFAWYSLPPQPIIGKEKNGIVAIDDSNSFYLEDFEAIARIFEWYGMSEELTLQPGQGYFIASNEDEIINRIRYEIYPLIKEYLQEGIMRSAKEELNTYFINRIKQSLFD